MRLRLCSIIERLGPHFEIVFMKIRKCVCIGWQGEEEGHTQLLLVMGSESLPELPALLLVMWSDASLAPTSPDYEAGLMTKLRPMRVTSPRS